MEKDLAKREREVGLKEEKQDKELVMMRRRTDKRQKGIRRVNGPTKVRKKGF